VVKTVFVGWGWGRRLLAAWVLVTTAGCYDVKSVDPGIEVVPDPAGRVDEPELGIRGQWFSYGDNDDEYPQPCTNIGKHAAAECSLVAFPEALPALKFPTQNGLLCTAGVVGEAVPCGLGVPNCTPNVADFSNMWGAGIGLDFDLDVSSGERDPLARSPWDAHAHHIAGVAFDLQLFDDGGLGGPHLRIEFPMLLPDTLKVQPGQVSFGLSDKDKDKWATPVVGDPPADYPDAPAPSEEHPKGSPYWGARAVFSSAKTDLSPVRVGHNEIRFSDTIRAPESDYVFDPTRLLGIIFHVPSFAADAPEPMTGEHFSYGFCISNFTFLRE
jgi:hypothetical protein